MKIIHINQLSDAEFDNLRGTELYATLMSSRYRIIWADDELDYVIACLLQSHIKPWHCAILSDSSAVFHVSCSNGRQVFRDIEMENSNDRIE